MQLLVFVPVGSFHVTFKHKCDATEHPSEVPSSISVKVTLGTMAKYGKVGVDKSPLERHVLG